MSTFDNNQNADVAENVGEGGEQAETVAVSRKEWETTNQTLGSLKRQLKDLQKSKEETKTPEQTKQPEELGLLQQRLDKQALKFAGITSEDEVELARTTAKKWGMDIESVVEDEDFKVKLDKLRDQKSNLAATSDIKGGAGTSQAKFTAAYWQAKGSLPTKDAVPDRKMRAKITREMMARASTNGKTFYND